MKIKYQLANETVTIEVEDSWTAILVDFDREEYNNNHRETRRHCSLDTLNPNDPRLSSDINVETEVLSKVDYEQLHKAISQLQPRQQELVIRVYFGGEKQSAIAKAEGISKTAITNRMKKIYACIRFILQAEHKGRP